MIVLLICVDVVANSMKRVDTNHLQEPTLFSGSLRFNLDPGNQVELYLIFLTVISTFFSSKINVFIFCNQFSDEDLHRALHSAGLTDLVFAQEIVRSRSDI